MTSQGGTPSVGSSGSDVALVLGELRYRRILSILLDRSQPMSRRELSAQIAAQEADVPPPAISETESKSVRIALEHRHLPKLQRLGLVDRTPDGLTATAPRPAPAEALSLPPVHEPEHPHWEPVSALLARPYRIAVATLLVDRQQPLPLAQLAEQLPEKAQEFCEDSLPPRLCTQLYHVDLPKLADTGLVEFDTEEQTVARTSLMTEIIDDSDN